MVKLSRTFEYLIFLSAQIEVDSRKSSTIYLVTVIFEERQTQTLLFVRSIIEALMLCNERNHEINMEKNGSPEGMDNYELRI